MASVWAQIFAVALCFAVFYVLILRPERQEILRQLRELESLQSGDTIVLGNGVFATFVRHESQNISVVLLGGQIEVQCDRQQMKRPDELLTTPVPVAEAQALQAPPHQA